MNRERYVRVILAHTFPACTAELLEFITFDCDEPSLGNISDDVVDELNRQFGEQVTGMRASQPSLLMIGGELTSEQRTAIRSYLTQAGAQMAKLTALDDDALRALFNKVENSRLTTERSVYETKAAERDKWDFFNDPVAEADWDRWMATAIWEPEEAIALSLGKEPSVVDSMALTPKGPGGHISLFRDEFARRLRLLSLGIDAQDLKYPIRPQAFAEWLHASAIEAPARLQDLGSKGASERKYQVLYENSQAEVGRLNSLLSDTRFDDRKGAMSRTTARKLILAMAIGTCRHNTAGNSRAVNYIERLLEQIDITTEKNGDFLLGNETIRNALSEAATGLDIQWPAVTGDRLVPFSDIHVVRKK